MSPYEAFFKTLSPNKSFSIQPQLRKDIFSKLATLYDEENAEYYLTRLEKRMAKLSVKPRMTGYSEEDAMLIAYGDHIYHGEDHPLNSLGRFANDHLDEMFNSIHLLPFFPYTSDDGFSISDYKHVDPDIGDWRDVREMAEDFNLMFDFVLNHTSASHPWFVGYRTHSPRYRNYYISQHPSTDLSQVVRPRANPLLTQRKTFRGKKHIWTTFSEDQVDLNYSNPQVLYEMLKILLLYVEQGAGLIRLDAVAFAWKEVGTASIHHRNTHLLVQLMRDVLDAAAPWVKIITETNVPHNENISYFADGKSEAQLVYNFSLPPLLVHSFHSGNAVIMTKWAKALKTPSKKTAFFNFAASHDGIGLRGATGLLSDEEIENMAKRVKSNGGLINYRANSDGSVSPYEMNTTFFDSLLEKGEDQQISINKFISSQAIVLALAGVPGIYLNSLFGAASWHEGYKQTKMNRTLNRQKFDLDKLKEDLSNPGTRTSQVFSMFYHLMSVRRKQPAFNPLAPQKVLDLSSRVFALERISEDREQRILALNNVSSEPVELKLPKTREYTDLLSTAKGKITITLQPYQTVWLETA